MHAREESFCKKNILRKQQKSSKQIANTFFFFCGDFEKQSLINLCAMIMIILMIMITIVIIRLSFY